MPAVKFRIARISLAVLWILVGMHPNHALGQSTIAANPTQIEYARVGEQALYLDLYLPEPQAETSMVVVWVHGGAWRAGSRKDVRVTRWLKHGIAIASVDYRLSTTAKFPAQIHDIKAAIRWLRSKSTDYGWKEPAFVVAGASAGGHLAVTVGVSNQHEQLEGRVGDALSFSSNIDAIVSFYGASNLQSILSQSTPFGLEMRRPALELLLGGQPDQQPELARLASPVLHLDPADPPLWLIHGDQDPQMPVNQSLELHGAYQSLGLTSHLEIVYGGKHGGDEFFADEQLDRIARQMQDALGVSKRPGLPPKQEIKLWNGEAPDEIPGIGEERTRMSPTLTPAQVEVTDSTRLITNVTVPSLTLYRPFVENDRSTTIVVCPGGGYWDLYWQLEGEEVADWLVSRGFTAAVLKYRVPRREGEDKTLPARRPLQDAQRAISLLRSEAESLKLASHQIGIIGFSAGGHLALATGTQWNQRQYPSADTIDQQSCRPDFIASIYPGYLKRKDQFELAKGMEIPEKMPPVFLAHGSADIISSPLNSVVMYRALTDANVPVEMHLYSQTAHDFAVRDSVRPYADWKRAFEAWVLDLSRNRKP